MSQRLRPLLLSLLFLVASLGVYQAGSTSLQPPTRAETPAGTWQQFAIADGEPVYLATFTFREVDGDFEVDPLDVAPCTQPQADFHTFDHHYDGQGWTFQSDWHQYGVARFELQKVAENRFEGYAYLDGVQRPYKHVLIRVGK